SVGTVNLFPFFGGALLQVVAGAILTGSGHDGRGYSTAGYQDMFLIYLVGAVISLVAAAFLKETLSRREPGEDG
ncbi:MAG: MFS transporter, partial [Thermodesulfobacteriota bacterium]